MRIEASDVAALLCMALPEFREAVEEHRNDWPDDPMLYLLVGALFQRMVDMPDGPERRDFVDRVYALTDEMLLHGSPSVRDCFSIEMIEPIANDPNQQYYPEHEAAVGATGRKDLAFKREWDRLYRGMKSAIERRNEQLGCLMFEAAGIGEGNASTRVIVNLSVWASLTENQRDVAYQQLSSDWEGMSGNISGLTLTGPVDSGFRVLRG